MSEQTIWESIKVEGSDLLHSVKKIIHEGNVRRVRIKQKDEVVAEFPLTVGVVGALLAPVLAAIGALAALLTECSIEVERVVKSGSEGKKGPKVARTRMSRPVKKSAS